MAFATRGLPRAACTSAAGFADRWAAWVLHGCFPSPSNHSGLGMWDITYLDACMQVHPGTLDGRSRTCGTLPWAFLACVHGGGCFCSCTPVRRHLLIGLRGKRAPWAGLLVLLLLLARSCPVMQTGCIQIGQRGARRAHAECARCVPCACLLCRQLLPRELQGCTARWLALRTQERIIGSPWCSMAACIASRRHAQRCGVVLHPSVQDQRARPDFLPHSVASEDRAHLGPIAAIKPCRKHRR